MEPNSVGQEEQSYGVRKQNRINLHLRKFQQQQKKRRRQSICKQPNWTCTETKRTTSKPCNPAVTVQCLIKFSLILFYCSYSAINPRLYNKRQLMLKYILGDIGIMKREIYKFNLKFSFTCLGRKLSDSQIAFVPILGKGSIV